MYTKLQEVFNLQTKFISTFYITNVPNSGITVLQIENYYFLLKPDQHSFRQKLVKQLYLDIITSIVD